VELMASSERYSDKTLYPIIALLVALSALFGLVVMPRLSPAGGGLVGKAAPDFSLPVVTGGDSNARQRLSDLHDKVVVLDFWASWCGPCAMQAPILDRISRKHPDDVVVMGINVGESTDVIRRYVDHKGLSYLMLADDAGEAQRLYGANTLPTVVLIDRQGHIGSYVQGVVRQAAIERAIRSFP